MDAATSEFRLLKTCVTSSPVPAESRCARHHRVVAISPISLAPQCANVRAAAAQTKDSASWQWVVPACCFGWLITHEVVQEFKMHVSQLAWSSPLEHYLATSEHIPVRCSCLSIRERHILFCTTVEILGMKQRVRR